MLFDENTSFADNNDLSEYLNNYSGKFEIENEDQFKSFIEDYEDEDISKEISILISTMEESITDSINIHFSNGNNNNNNDIGDDEQEELFMILSKGSLGMMQLKPRSIRHECVLNNKQPSFISEPIKQKSSNVLIHRPIPKKKA